MSYGGTTTYTKVAASIGCMNVISDSDSGCRLLIIDFQVHIDLNFLISIYVEEICLN